MDCGKGMPAGARQDESKWKFTTLISIMEGSASISFSRTSLYRSWEHLPSFDSYGRECKQLKGADQGGSQGPLGVATLVQAAVGRSLPIIRAGAEADRREQVQTQALVWVWSGSTEG